MFLLTIGDRLQLLAADQRAYIIRGKVVNEVLLPGLTGVPPLAHHGRQLTQNFGIQMAGIALD